MDLGIVRPEHLDDDSWSAIEQHGNRLATAIKLDDRPWIVGSAKELVEAVARCVIQAKNLIVASNADFSEVLNTAHAALDRQPGRDVSLSPDVRDIAASAKKIVLSVRNLRNDAGTGHGRATITPIDEEKATIVVDAAMLWVRWALRRLEHILLGEADNLIAELSGGIVTRRKLALHLEGSILPDQPVEMQRALGVAFAERAAGGTFVAREVGIDGPTNSTDLRDWPIDYRLGIAEGLTLTSNGFLTLSEGWGPVLASVLAPVPPATQRKFLESLALKIVESGHASYQDASTRGEVASAIRDQVDDSPSRADSGWLAVASAIETGLADDE